jgi:S-adenosylmethionine synthetase
VIVDTCEAINEIGYNDPDRRFNAAGVSVLNLFSRQAADIACVWTMGTTLVPTATSSARTQVNHGSVSEKSWQLNKTLDKWADESLT